MTSPARAHHRGAVDQVRDGADDGAGRVDDQPGRLVERADDVAGAVDDRPGALVQGADDGAGGVHHHRAVHGVAGCGVGKGVGGRVRGVGRRHHGLLLGAGAVGRCRPGPVGHGVGLVDGAVLDAGRDRVRVHRLVDGDPLVGQRLGARVVGQQVGAHRCVDRRHDVGVEGDGEVDGCCPVDREVDVSREVEDRHDLLVRQCGHPLGGHLFRRDRCELLRAHRVSLSCIPTRGAGCSSSGLMRPSSPGHPLALRARAWSPEVTWTGTYPLVIAVTLPTSRALVQRPCPRCRSRLGSHTGTSGRVRHVAHQAVSSAARQAV